VAVVASVPSVNVNFSIVVTSAAEEAAIASKMDSIVAVDFKPIASIVGVTIVKNAALTGTFSTPATPVSAPAKTPVVAGTSIVQTVVVYAAGYTLATLNKTALEEGLATECLGLPLANISVTAVTTGTLYQSGATKDAAVNVTLQITVPNSATAVMVDNKMAACTSANLAKYAPLAGLVDFYAFGMAAAAPGSAPIVAPSPTPATAPIAAAVTNTVTSVVMLSGYTPTTFVAATYASAIAKMLSVPVTAVKINGQPTLTGSPPALAVNTTISATTPVAATAITSTLKSLSTSPTLLAQLKTDGLSSIVSAGATEPVQAKASSGASAVPDLKVSSRLFTAGVVALSVLSGSSLVVCLIVAALPKEGSGVPAGYVRMGAGHGFDDSSHASRGGGFKQGYASSTMRR
jgi:hypothetical protein